MKEGLTIRRLRSFDDLGAVGKAWQQLLGQGPTNVVFLTREWQATWWECYGRGELLLFVAERRGRVEAIAPMFLDSGMVYFVGSGGSDYLDFIGNCVDPEILHGFLREARAVDPNFVGFLFYHVLTSSPTGALLRKAAERLGLLLVEEGGMRAPVLDLAILPERATAATQKHSLVRHERHFARTGVLVVAHVHDGGQIASDLEAFFDQHTRRWKAIGKPALFERPSGRRFFARLTEVAGNTGWLRFCKITHDGRPIAFHFGFMYEGEYFWYKPSFEMELAKYSPGEVLLRQVLLVAISEGARVFDFGLGDEDYKARFATGQKEVCNWGLYDPGVGQNKALYDKGARQ